MAGQIGETIAILGTIDPVDAATSAKSSDWVAFAKFDKLAAYLSVGNVTGTIDMKLQEATDSSGTSAQDISGKSITQLAATDDNKQAIISIDRSELSSGFTHVKAVVTPTGGTANLVSVLILGAIGRYNPVSSQDLATVAEIVN